jgi:hypothetical protein
MHDELCAWHNLGQLLIVSGVATLCATFIAVGLAWKMNRYGPSQMLLSPRV